MDITQIEDQIDKSVALLPGSRDRHGGPVIFFPANADGYTYEYIVPLVSYLGQVNDEATRNKGFTVVIDMKTGVIKYLKTIIRACQQALYGYLRQVLIIKPDQFLDKSKINFELMIEAYECRTVVVSSHKLSKYIDISQILVPFGGTFAYDHRRWIAIRRAYEKLLMDGSHMMRMMRKEQEKRGVNVDESACAVSSEGRGSISGMSTTTTDDSIFKKGTQSPDLPKLTDIIEQGECLLEELEKDRGLVKGGETPMNPDCQLIAQRIETVLKELQDQKAENSPRNKRKQLEIQKHEKEVKQLQEQFSEGASNLCDWLLGPGEKWLLTLHEIGESKDEAKQLYREHEQLESRVQEINVQVTELDATSDRLVSEMSASPPSVTLALRNQRRHVDSVAGAFSTRFYRQKDVLQSSIHFHNCQQHVRGGDRA